MELSRGKSQQWGRQRTPEECLTHRQSSGVFPQAAYLRRAAPTQSRAASHLSDQSSHICPRRSHLEGNDQHVLIGLDQSPIARMIVRVLQAAGKVSLGSGAEELSMTTNKHPGAMA